MDSMMAYGYQFQSLAIGVLLHAAHTLRDVVFVRLNEIDHIVKCVHQLLGLVVLEII